ncbi:MAG: hypothetical protein EA359_04885 [Balneolaceae bacterium]|nr:MAG: hypothetical protein EA359_04885 [Balneolaceae bacterium]
MRAPFLFFFVQLITFVLVLSLFSGVSAQQASIQGIVSDRTNSQPLFGANVILTSSEDELLRIGAAVEGDGFYRIGNISPGVWYLRISFIGYTAYQDTLTFSPGENKAINAELSMDDTLLGELVVARITGATRSIEGAQRITPAEIRRVPSPAAGDLSSYIQTLPGVVTTGDRGGQVFIRGGSPSENMVLIDGALIYQPTHIVGFFSPIPSNVIAGADFYAGGFSPKYTGRISSVLDVQLRHGDRYNTSGSLSVSPFAAEVFAEGPIETGTSSWIFSARNSFIDRTSSWYPIERQPLQFQSQFIKTSFIQDETRCSGMLLHTLDSGQMDFDFDEKIRWRNIVVGARCVALPQDSGTLLTTNINVSSFSNSVGNIKPYGFESSAMRVNIDVELRQHAGNIRFDYGIFSRLKYLNYSLGENYVGFNSASATQFVAGGHVQATLPAGNRLNFQPGVGFSYNGAFGGSIEPRLRYSWRPFGRETEEFSGSAGLYLQPITGVSDIRDVSSVFVAWMSAPLSTSQLQSFHTTVGWQQQFPFGLTWSVETYYKRMSNIAIPVWNTLTEFTTELALANGYVYGSDLRLEFNRGRFYSLIGYGYNWTLYESAQDHFTVWFGEPLQEFHPPHDRRHQVNVLASVDAGKYTAGVRWQLGSGMPFTRPLGFDDVLDFRQRLPDVNRERGTRRVIIDRPYEGRLPSVHRLDVSVERTFRIASNGSNLNFQAGVINTYDQRNIFYYDVYTDRRIDQLSFAPYLTIKLEVK